MTRRSLVLLAFLLVPLRSFAQSNDQLAFNVLPVEPHAGEAFTVELQVFAPQHDLEDVRVDWTLPSGTRQWIDPRCRLLEGQTYRCAIDWLLHGNVDVLRASVVAPPSGAFNETRAIFVNPAPVTPFAKDKQLTIRTPSKLAPSIVMPDANAWKNGNVVVHVTFDTIVAPARLDFVRVSITVPELVRFVPPEGWSCEFTNQTVFCTMPSLTKQTVSIEARRSPSLADAIVYAGIEWRDQNYFNETARAQATASIFDHESVVSTTADSGAGSLRQAIAEANGCEYPRRCRIVFSLPDDATIRVLSPLPEIAGSAVTLDATVGRTTKVAIDGSALANGAGLVVAPNHFGAVIRGLAVHSFRGNGIECRGECVIESNYVGLDADGFTPRANAQRGVYVSGEARIENNVISGNWRSGIFIDAGGSGIATGNFIGVGADGVRPIGNGASGIFVGPQSFSFRSFFASGNVIAYSNHFGVAIAREQVRIGITGNRFIGNRQSDIDVGLDGRNLPGIAIFSSQYDAASDSTFFFGSVDVIGRHAIALYADGEPLGSLGITNQKWFLFRASGNHTGRAITANLVTEDGFPEFLYFRTTELSESLVPPH